MKHDDERFMTFLKALKTIEQEINRNTNVNRIEKGILDATWYNKRYFDYLFKSITGKSLHSYIRDINYNTALKELSENKQTLKQKESYHGINNFAQNFKRIYGISLEEALKEKSFTDDKCFTASEIEKIIEIKNDVPLISTYDFINGLVHLTLRNDTLLLFIFSQKTYVIHKLLIDNLHPKDDISKKLMIILIENAGKNFENKKITIQREDLENELEHLSVYNLDNPYEMDDYYFFTIAVPDVPVLFDVFKNLIYTYVGNIYFLFSGKKDKLDEYNKMFFSFEKCKGTYTIQNVAKIGGWTEEAVVEILWDMLRKGIARISL